MRAYCLLLCIVFAGCGSQTSSNKVSQVLQLRSASQIEQELTQLLTSGSERRSRMETDLKEAGFRLVRRTDACNFYSYEEPERDSRDPLEYRLSVRADWCGSEAKVRAWYTGL